MSRRIRISTDDEAVVVSSVDPTRQSSAAIMHRWDMERLDCDREERRALEATNQELTGPIYPRELGEAIARETARMIPDWRLIRTEHPAWVRKLIAQQPETNAHEVKQYGALLRMIRDHLVGHLRPFVNDLEAIIELRAVAREASAFLIGCEVGRHQAHMYVDAKGRLVKQRQPRAPVAGGVGEGLRLHFGQEGGAR